MLGAGEGLGHWHDGGDGAYHALYQFTMSGEYEVDVGVGGVLAGGGDTKAVFVVPAAPAEPAQGEFRRGNLGNSPPADASFGGVSHVLGDNTSPTFRPSVSPQTRFIHVVG